MKKITAILLCAVMCVFIAGCSSEPVQESSEQKTSSDTVSSVPEVPAPDGFRVEGTKLIDGYGEE